MALRIHTLCIYGHGKGTCKLLGPIPPYVFNWWFQNWQTNRIKDGRFKKSAYLTLVHGLGQLLKWKWQYHVYHCWFMPQIGMIIHLSLPIVLSVSVKSRTGSDVSLQVPKQPVLNINSVVVLHKQCRYIYAKNHREFISNTNMQNLRGLDFHHRANARFGFDTTWPCIIQITCQRLWTISKGSKPKHHGLPT
jgi:hypothetical protein